MLPKPRRRESGTATMAASSRITKVSRKFMGHPFALVPEPSTAALAPRLLRGLQRRDCVRANGRIDIGSEHEDKEPGDDQSAHRSGHREVIRAGGIEGQIPDQRSEAGAEREHR